MTYSTQRKLRKQMYMARNTVCTHDNEQNNLEICKRLVNLRRELAQLLGSNLCRLCSSPSYGKQYRTCI